MLEMMIKGYFYQATGCTVILCSCDCNCDSDCYSTKEGIS